MANLIIPPTILDVGTGTVAMISDGTSANVEYVLQTFLERFAGPSCQVYVQYNVVNHVKLESA